MVAPDVRDRCVCQQPSPWECCQGQGLHDLSAGRGGDPGHLSGALRGTFAVLQERSPWQARKKQDWAKDQTGPS